jgi:hypothetical protein
VKAKLQNFLDAFGILLSTQIKIMKFGYHLMFGIGCEADFVAVRMILSYASEIDLNLSTCLMLAS